MIVGIFMYLTKHMTVMHSNKCRAYIALWTFCAKNCAAISSAALLHSVTLAFSAQQLIKTRFNSVSILIFSLSVDIFGAVNFVSRCVVVSFDCMPFIITVVIWFCECFAISPCSVFQYNAFDSIIRSYEMYVVYLIFIFDLICLLYIFYTQITYAHASLTLHNRMIDWKPNIYKLFSIKRQSPFNTIKEITSPTNFYFRIYFQQWLE